MRDILLFCFKPQDLERKRRDSAEAFFTDSPTEFKKFLTNNKIDYFMLETYIYENDFIDSLKKSITPYNRELYKFIKSKNNNKFAALEFAKKFYDFKIVINGTDVFIVPSRKIS